jgi:4-hydroxybenzoate polyprenyltransferase
MRPREWVKNVLVFAGLIFSQSLGTPSLVVASFSAFALFCVAASAIYLLNDLMDRTEDMRHPVKRNRPLPSGRLRPSLVLVVHILLALGALTGGYALHRGLGAVLTVYLAMNIAYSTSWKHVVILDVMLIAIGFVLRAVAGAIVVGAVPSPWLVLCTLTLALLVGFGKRRHELSVLGETAAQHRSSLRGYSTTFLDSMMTVSAAAAVVTYALYTMSPEIVERFGRMGLIVTTPFVLFGIFRYLYLVHQKREGGDPARAFVSDIPTVVNGTLWIVTSCVVIYAPWSRVHW